MPARRELYELIVAEGLVASWPLPKGLRSVQRYYQVTQYVEKLFLEEIRLCQTRLLTQLPPSLLLG